MCCTSLRTQLKYFNPRSHEGNDISGKYEFHSCLEFQSTFPRGERRYPIGHGTYCYDFNPRSHEGNDLTMSGTETGILNFNPRSHEGNDRSEVQCVVG